MENQYTVLEWGSHPHEGNDDCWQGSDFDTEEEAQAFLKAKIGNACGSVAYYELDGPDKNEITKNPAYVETGDSDSEFQRAWQSEIAMEAGMMHGAEAYNCEMGWGE